MSSSNISAPPRRKVSRAHNRLSFGPPACRRSAAHREIGARIGVTGTPLFLIDGHVVAGADIPLMQKILDGKK